jgi:hypothetical protein
VKTILSLFALIALSRLADLEAAMRLSLADAEQRFAGLAKPTDQHLLAFASRCAHIQFGLRMLIELRAAGRRKLPLLWKLQLIRSAEAKPPCVPTLAAIDAWLFRLRHVCDHLDLCIRLCREPAAAQPEPAADQPPSSAHPGEPEAKPTEPHADVAAPPQVLHRANRGGSWPRGEAAGWRGRASPKRVQHGRRQDGRGQAGRLSPCPPSWSSPTLCNPQSHTPPDAWRRGGSHHAARAPPRSPKICACPALQLLSATSRAHGRQGFAAAGPSPRDA